MFNQNNASTQQTKVFYRDPPAISAPIASIYLDNGVIIDRDAYDMYNKVIEKGYLRQTNNNNIFTIHNQNGKQVGVFDMSTGPSYGVSQSNTMSSGNLNNGMINVSGVSGNTSGMVVVGTSSNSGFSTMNGSIATPTVEQKIHPMQPHTSKEEKEIVLIPGSEFLPIPTFYTDIKYVPIGDYFRPQIIIKKGEDMDTEKNSLVYEELKKEAATGEPTLVGVYDQTETISLDIQNKSSIEQAINISSITKNKNIIFNGYALIWGLNTIREKTNDPIVNDVIYKGAAGSFYENRLADLASRYNTLETLLKSIDRELENMHYAKSVIASISEIIDEEYGIVEDFIHVNGAKVESLGTIIEQINTLIRENVEDITILNRYDEAKANVYRRLTNPESLKKFRYISHLMLSEPENKTVSGFGLYESFLCLSTRDAVVIKELQKLIDNADDTNTYLVDVNTPNLKKLISDLMTGNVRFEKSQDINYSIDKYSVNPYQMVLYCLSSKFKVYRKNDQYFVTRIS